ncbi:flagellar motor protein MotB [Salinibacterium sp. ZJ454]|uniref:OmpA/MotB family protein n=1 Tax=Salinibacterium sp. ZJ454 TaxID=2708339 RepID=UPI00141E8609|nr:flagellar motor protein MotB [Salinibacterium sp. ZJ454]
MSSRRRAQPVEVPDEHPDERWMASYMDMVTVLMCLFIVLFAMSTVDQKKFEELANSLATGFGAEASETVDTAEGVVVPAQLMEEDAVGFSPVELARLEVARLDSLEEQIRLALEAKNLLHAVTFELTERGLVVRLVGSETYFETNRTDLIGVAPQVLDAIGPVLAPTPYEISVEGHADLRASVFPYDTNWELSSGRATAVLRHLVENNGVAAARIGAVGYGSSRPAAAGGTAEELALNRRVDIVVLSDQPDEVRALLAGVAAETGGVG